MRELNIKKLEKLRISNGYSVEKVSFLLGYNSRSAYSLKTSGKRSFTVSDLVRLSDLYHITIDDLMTEKTDRKVVIQI